MLFADEEFAREATLTYFHPARGYKKKGGGAERFSVRCQFTKRHSRHLHFFVPVSGPRNAGVEVSQTANPKAHTTPCQKEWQTTGL